MRLSLGTFHPSIYGFREKLSRGSRISIVISIIRRNNDRATIFNLLQQSSSGNTIFNLLQQSSSGNTCQQDYYLQSSSAIVIRKHEQLRTSTCFRDVSRSKLLTVYNIHGRHSTIFVCSRHSTYICICCILFRVITPNSTIFVNYEGNVLEFE